MDSVAPVVGFARPALRFSGRLGFQNRLETSIVSSQFEDDGEQNRKRKRNVTGAAALTALGAAALLSKSRSDLDKSEQLVSVCCESPAQVKNPPIDNKLDGAVIFCGNANKQLAEVIATNLGTTLGNVKLKRFADGEISLQFLDSLRGKDVYIIQPTSPPVNENLMELLLMISTCRRSSAKKITAVVPYYGYARQDRKLSSREPISAADVARMIEAMGVDRVISVDLHCGQIQGFFGPRVPVDNLEAQKVGLQYFRNKNLSHPVIVSPDAGGVYRARKFQERFTAMTKNKATGLAMLIKQRAKANEIEKMELVGQVEGADVIIVDDMIDTAGTLCEAARMLRTHGAKRIFCFATHGLFSGPAIDRITNSPLEEVVVSDSIKQSSKAAACPRVTQLSIGPLLADAIYRVHKKESIHHVFYDHSDEEKNGVSAQAH
eukprot:Gregarina_sp_Pseudo_9__5250@NODE_596_length_2524_cov_39_433803_g562_i0_p1_GENE_NODE_596_length_2524_cov_39_433803_g562_i0NODE_596_length_2524_cov_39_433803_g562_i0_p1_ORF_typecomplete_len434_score86_30Pribosyltran_N/PF13793_6/9_7e47Pribosyltran_N/PF13793_6/8_3Pribosyl_synth/PF14572_6/4_1e03Pribosyl_synth/PF14572_6/2_7e42Pribosyltran/PF00156_27/2_1e03Pribosyltran/PF00156_27/9_7e15UPRTase/PF14681_6/5_6e05Flavodoxin_3/PF12641_7/1_5e03Flavodoxin_3/PF12641_7/2_9e03Flavodoxin_3/PF12641_7/0_00058Fucose